MENKSTRVEALRKRIEQVLAKKNIEVSTMSNDDIDEILLSISEHKDDLRITDDIYHELFLDAPIGYVVVDKANVLRAVNKAFGLMVNANPEQIIGEHITSYIHPDFCEQYLVFVSKVVEEKGRSSILVKLIGDTKEQYVKLECNIHRTSTGDYFRMGFIDVTREVVNEQQLIDSRERYRAVTEYAYNWEYWQDPRGHIIYMSPSCERITGYNKFEFFENPNLIESIVHPNDKKVYQLHKVESNYQQELSSSHFTEFRIVQKSGEVRWISHVCKNIFKDDGTHLGVRSTNIDITEEKIAEQELERQKQFLQTILQTSADGFLVVDSNGYINQVNSAYCSIIGFTPDELVGMNISSIEAKDTGKDIAARIRRIAQNGSEIFETIHKHKDGHLIDVEISASFVDNYGGQFVCFCRDITLRHQTERELYDSKQELLAKNEELVNLNSELSQSYHALNLVMKELSVNEMRYRAISKNTSDFTFSCVNGSKGYHIDWLAGATQKVTGYSIDEIKKHKCWKFMVCPSHIEIFNSKIINLKPNEQSECDLKITTKQGKQRWIKVNTSCHFDNEVGTEILVGGCQDITDNRNADQERDLTIRMLSLINSDSSVEGFLTQALQVIKGWSECTAVAIRLSKDSDFPYIASEGFDPDFLHSEQYLCNNNSNGALCCDLQGSPMLDCMCGCVIQGRSDSSLPFFSRWGSFWTNSSSELVGSIPHNQIPFQIRGRCVSEGFESVALIPIRKGKITLGLIQLNDRRRNLLDKDKISLLERLASNVGVAIAERRAREEVAVSEAMYRRLTENMSDVVWTSDLNLNLTYVSPSVRKLFGCSPEEHMARPIQQRHPVESIGIIQTILKEELGKEQGKDTETKRSMVVEVQAAKSDGTLIWVAINVSFIRNSEGIPIGIQGSTRDITKQKEVEVNLRDSELTFRALFEKSPLGVAYHKAIFDENGKPVNYFFIDANENYKQLTGVDPRGKLVTEAFPGIENDPFNWIETFCNVARNGNEVRFQQYLQPNDRWYDCVAYQYMPDHFVASFLEITDAKRAEMALRNSEEKYRMLFEANKDGIAIFRIGDDLESQLFIDFNMAAAQMLGYTPQEFAALKVTDLELDLDPDFARNRMENLKRFGVVEFETKLRHKTRGFIYADVKAIALSYNNQPVILNITRDITERKKAIDALKENQERVNSILSVAPIGIGVVKDRTFTEVNRMVLEMTGYTSEELLGHSAKILYPSQQEYDFVGQEKYRQIHEKGSGTVETEWVRKDGTLLNIILSSTPIAPNDLSQGVTFTAHDITERKIREKFTEARLRLLEYADSLDLNDFLKQTLNEAEQLTSSSIGFYHFIDEGSELIHLKQWSDRTLNEFCNLEAIPREPYPIEAGGAWTECIRKRKPVVHNDFISLKIRKGMPQGHVPVIRELVVPVIRNRKVVAVLGIGNKEVNYNSYDIEVIAQLADMAWDIAERKIAQETLRLSEEKYRQLFENMTQGFALHEIILDDMGNPVDYRFIDANPAFERLTGIRVSDIIGKTVREVMPQTESHWIENYGHVAQTGEPIRYENYSKEIGKYFAVRAFSPQRGRFATVFTDITLRRLAEKTVQRLSKGIEQSPAMIVITDKTGNIEYVNPKFTEVTGYLYTEAVGQNPRILNSGKQSTEVYEGLWSTILSGNDWHGEVVNRKKNGHLYWESILISPITDDDGEIINFIAIKEDITERKNAILNLEQNNRLINTMLDNLPVGIFMVDAQTGKPLIANEHAKRLLGQGINTDASAENLPEVYHAYIAGTNVFYPAEQTPIILGTKGVVSRIDDMEIEHPDGKRLLLEVFGCPVRSSNSDIWASLVGFHDITDRKRAEESLRQSEMDLKEKNEEYVALNEELTESNERIIKINQDLIMAREKAVESDRLKSAFLANMSHEIRTPMNAIIGFSEMLLNPRLPSEKKDFFSRILNTACHQLLSVVEDVIDISKIETGQMDVHEGKTNLNYALKRIHEIFQPQASANNVEVRYVCPFSSIESDVLTDTTKLNQILTNLVSNAVKFTEKGFIEIGYSLKGNLIEFYVKDTGVGIAPENHQLIFERFRQVELDTTRKYGGTGLGLSISIAFIEMLGGTIWVNSEVGKGSTFRFTIPYKPVGEATHQTIEEEDAYDFTSKIILIAEDEEANFIFIQELIEETSATILRAHNGREAVDRFIDEPKIDLIIMDIKMPELTGIEATSIIRGMNSTVPIIALTAYAMSGDREKCLEVGCNGYLSKPVRRNDLLRRMAQLLD